ncbi:hypothetical protein HK405_007376 [Cladochytrium tenue]|nr:hypothetical protein HK405_007376 [Cladochytrium tenue]
MAHVTGATAAIATAAIADASSNAGMLPCDAGGANDIARLNRQGDPAERDAPPRRAPLPTPPAPTASASSSSPPPLLRSARVAAGGSSGSSGHSVSFALPPDPYLPGPRASTPPVLISSSLAASVSVSFAEPPGQTATSKGRAAHLASRKDSNLPEIIVFSPEEELDEPSISCAPNNCLVGLPNPTKSRVVSLLNATLQLFVAVPEMTDELPAAPADETVRQFVETAIYLLCEAEGAATADAVSLSWWRTLAGLPSPLRVEDGGVIGGTGEDDSLDTVRDYGRPAHVLIENILLPCRIGRRFASKKAVDGVIVPADPRSPRTEQQQLDAITSRDPRSPRTEQQQLDAITSRGNLSSGLPSSPLVAPKETPGAKAAATTDSVAAAAASVPLSASNIAALRAGAGGFAAAAEKDRASLESLRDGGAAAHSPHVLSISLTTHDENETVGLIPLLYDLLGIRQPPRFFFGGSPAPFGSRSRSFSSTSSSSSSPFKSGSIFAGMPGAAAEAAPFARGAAAAAAARPASPLTVASPPQPEKPRTLFARLPHFLVIEFERELLRDSSPTFRRTAVELPMDLDLGFATDSKATTTSQPGRQQDKQQSKGTGVPGGGRAAAAQPASTFYKLHGFMTQTEGRFLTYTRLRGQNGWFRCEDEDVAPADLVGRVVSKGVVMALYRLQMPKRA